MKSGNRRTPADGFGSFVTIVVSLLVALLLIVLYLREVVPSGARGGTKGTAVDAARRQAQAFEEQQRKRLDEMNEVTR